MPEKSCRYAESTFRKGRPALGILPHETLAERRSTSPGAAECNGRTPVPDCYGGAPPCGDDRRGRRPNPGRKLPAQRCGGDARSKGDVPETSRRGGRPFPRPGRLLPSAVGCKPRRGAASSNPRGAAGRQRRFVAGRPDAARRGVRGDQRPPPASLAPSAARCRGELLVCRTASLTALRQGFRRRREGFRRTPSRRPAATDLVPVPRSKQPGSRIDPRRIRREWRSA